MYYKFLSSNSAKTRRKLCLAYTAGPRRKMKYTGAELSQLKTT